MAWGGKREGAGRKPASTGKKANPRRARVVAAPKLKATVPAEPKAPAMPAIDPRAFAMMLPEIQAISEKYSRKGVPRTPEMNPFRFPEFPTKATPPSTMAMDNALVAANSYAGNAWLNAGDGFAEEGLLFLGYPYLAELAQRPEYRVISETIADDATRKWIDFDVTGDEKLQKEKSRKDPVGFAESQADPDARKKRLEAAGKLDKVKALKDDQERLGVQMAFYDQARNDGFFGRSHLFLQFGGPEIRGAELATPIGDGRGALSKGKIALNSFTGLKTIEPVWTYPQAYNSINPLTMDWYNPQRWYVMGQEIDASRLLTFVGHPVPDLLKPAYSFGGLSLSQMAKPYVDIWLTTRQSVADLIHSFSVMVLMTDLSTTMQPGNAGALLARVAMFNMLRDNQGAFVINKNTEDFKNVSASLGGLHELQAQAQEHMAAVHRIPLVKFTGIQPAGLNASSEGEIKVYDDTIGAYQTRFMRPNLVKVVNFQQLSLFGEIDPEITIKFNPLREMTQAEKGQKQKDDADRDDKYVAMGALAPAEVRKIIIDDPDLPYAGLDPDDVPEPPEPEMPPGAGSGGDGDEQDDESSDDEQGGEANDAALPFASDAAFNEGDHPRAPNGEFGAGGGGSTKPAKLTPTEKAYVDSYSGDEFLKLNAKLRAGEEGGAAVSKLDSAVSKGIVAPGTKLYRGISKDALKALVKGDTINAGQELTDPGFLSTSTSSTIANMNAIGGVVMEITVGEGQRGLDMATLSRNAHEKEVMLPRNSKMRVVGLRAPKSPGDPIIVRVTTQNEG